MGDKVRALQLAGNRRADPRLMGDPERLRSRAQEALDLGGSGKKRFAALQRLADAEIHRAEALEAARPKAQRARAEAAID